MLGKVVMEKPWSWGLKQSGVLGMCRVKGGGALVPGQCNSRSFLEEAYSSASSLGGLK